MTIKTFRGLLADGAEDRIRLRTNDGNIGYRIVKFEIMPYNPGSSVDSVVKIFNIKGKAISSYVNFSDNDLVAAATWYNGTYETDHSVTFDNELFNQDIYITHHEDTGSMGMNYYLELEQVKLNNNESTMATLQSIRSRYESYTPAGPT